MGAHLVVKEATVNVAPLAVLFSVNMLTKKSQESVPVDDENDDDDEL